MGQYLYQIYSMKCVVSPVKSLLNCFVSEQCVESRLQVKMNSPDSARDISIKQEEPEDQPHFSKFNHFKPSIAMLGEHVLKKPCQVLCSLSSLQNGQPFCWLALAIANRTTTLINTLTGITGWVQWLIYATKLFENSRTSYETWQCQKLHWIP